MEQSDAPSTYSLLDEPWLPVIMADGSLAELSLREVFAQAANIRALTADTAVIEVALLRLLVAIVLRATDEPDRTLRDAQDAWASWWEDWSIAEGLVQDHLTQYEERFDLLHPTTPFMQVASLSTASGSTSGLQKLVPNINGLFTMRRRAGRDGVSLGEAARLLVCTQAFDASGIKTGAMGDERVKKGKGFSNNMPAWAGAIGNVVLEGGCLAETLLLNAPINLETHADSVVWERPPQSSTTDVGHPFPAGPADLLTWQSRRIRLFVGPSKDRIGDVILANGDLLKPHGLFGMEPMTAWRVSEAQTKRAGAKVWWPVSFDPTRWVWRGIEPLLARNEGGPRNLKWLATLRRAESVPADLRVQLRTVGLTYGPQNAKVSAAVDDHLTLQVAALVSPALTDAAGAAAETARQGVGAISVLAWALAQATGTDDGVARAKAAARAYDALDQPFRQWLAGLHDAEGEVRARVHSLQWRRQVRHHLSALGRGLCQEAGARAVVGRVIDNTLFDTADAWRRFTHRLHGVTDTTQEPGNNPLDQPSNHQLDQGEAR